MADLAPGRAGAVRARGMARQADLRLVVCYSGNLADAGKAVAPIRALLDPVMDRLHQQPYLQLQSFLDESEPTGSHYYWQTEYMAELSDGLLTTVRDLFSTALLDLGR